MPVAHLRCLQAALIGSICSPSFSLSMSGQGEWQTVGKKRDANKDAQKQKARKATSTSQAAPADAAPSPFDSLDAWRRGEGAEPPCLVVSITRGTNQADRGHTSRARYSW